MAGPPDGYIILENFPTVGDDTLSGRRPYQLDGAASLSQIERTASLPQFSGRSNIMKRGI